jgi:hypothetical protein
MKTLVVTIIIVILFLIVFIESNTWEVKVVTEERGGNEYFIQKHTLNWDRFINYLKEIPSNILKKFSLEK